MVASTQYRDRVDGGRRLVEALHHHRGNPAVVLGLPRGGIVTAEAVAEGLGLPLDFVVAQKLGHPGSQEYAIGAITPCGEVVLNSIASLECTPEYLHEEQQRKLKEAQRRSGLFRQRCPETSLEGKTAILVDDGIATGYTMKAAILAVLKRHPSRLVVAAPVASDRVFLDFNDLADEVVVPLTPRGFFAVGAHYRDFSQVTDDEVLRILSARCPAA